MDLLKQKIVDLIDSVVYINLEHRTDRNEHMKKITAMFGTKVHRFNAIKCNSGMLGCTMSHISVVKLAIQNKWNNILILEDDVEWNDSMKGYMNLLDLLTRPYDVIMLGGGYCNFDKKTFKLSKANHTHAYLVHKNYFETLLMNFEEGKSYLELSINSNKCTYDFGIDIYWLKLIKQHNWFIVLPNILYQKNDYSDIDKKQTAYTNNIFLLSDTLNIKRALWGFNSNIIDVTEEVKMIPQNTDIALRQSFFRIDPCVGQQKCLYIEYTNGSIQFGIERTNINIINY